MARPKGKRDSKPRPGARSIKEASRVAHRENIEVTHKHLALTSSTFITNLGDLPVPTPEDWRQAAAVAMRFLRRAVELEDRAVTPVEAMACAAKALELAERAGDAMAKLEAMAQAAGTIIAESATVVEWADVTDVSAESSRVRLAVATEAASA